MKWYELKPSERSTEQLEEAHCAYYKTRLGDKDSREVWCDIMRRLDVRSKGIETNEQVVSQYLLEAFFAETLKLCGVFPGMELLKSMAPIARSFEPPEPPTDIPEGFTE